MTLAGWAVAAADGPVLPRPVPGFVPDPERATCRLDPSGAWFLPGDSVGLRLAPLDDALRVAYLKRAAGTESDPFAARSDGRPSFLTFHVTVENREHASLVFEPQRCWLRTNLGQVRVPLDAVSAGSAYRLRGGELPAAYRPAMETLLGGDEVLARAESAGGLLAYESVRPKTRSFVVELHASTGDGEHRTCRAAYRRETKKERKAREAAATGGPPDGGP